MSTIVEEGKKYFDELLSQFDEKTWSFHPAEKDDGPFIAQNPKFYEFITLVSKHLEKEKLLGFATRMISSANTINFAKRIHRHLLPEWKTALDKFVRQLKVVEWTMDYNRNVKLKIRLCSSPLHYLLVRYNAYQISPSEREKDDDTDSDEDENKANTNSDDENEAAEMCQLKLYLQQNGDASESLLEESSLKDLLAIKNSADSVGLIHLPLNIWLSCLFGMITTLLTNYETETADYCPDSLGNSLKVETEKLQKQNDQFELVAAENQCWVPDRNIRAPCYLRFVNDDDSRHNHKKRKHDAVSENGSKSGEDDDGDDVKGRWIQIPEKLSGLFIYRDGTTYSEKELERITIEVCASVRDNLLREFVDCTFLPISPKLQQDAHAFLKMVKFVGDLTEEQYYSSSAQGGEDWWVDANANERITATISSNDKQITTNLFRCASVVGGNGKRTKCKRSIYCDETRDTTDTTHLNTREVDAYLFTKINRPAIHKTSKHFPAEFVCPLLSDPNHSVSGVRELLSWMFILDDESSCVRNFGNSIFPEAGAIESLYLSDIRLSKLVRKLSIVRYININRDLKKHLVDALNTSLPGKKKQLNSDLSTLVLGYAVTFGDPIQQKIRYSNSRKSKRTSGDDE